MKNKSNIIIYSKILGYSLSKARYDKWKSKVFKSIYSRIISGLFFGAFFGLLTENFDGILLCSMLAIFVALLPHLIMLTPITYYLKISLSIILFGTGSGLFFILVNSYRNIYDVKIYFAIIIGILIALSLHFRFKDLLFSNPSEYDDDFVLQKIRENAKDSINSK